MSLKSDVCQEGKILTYAQNFITGDWGIQQQQCTGYGNAIKAFSLLIYKVMCVFIFIQIFKIMAFFQVHKTPVSLKTVRAFANNFLNFLKNSMPLLSNAHCTFHIPSVSYQKPVALVTNKSLDIVGYPKQERSSTRFWV